MEEKSGGLQFFLDGIWGALKCQKESSSPLVRRVVKTKSRECFHASRAVSYSTLRDEFKKFVKPFVGDIALYTV